MTDPSLAWKCWTGPCTPYQYRLQGPHPWEGARDAIMTQWDRIVHPLHSRKVDTDEKESSSIMLLVILFVVLAVIVGYIFY